ncbi:cyclic nucleotide-binding domain protein (macronuclear) [Tetrahymena thermophila SB210]|uniref:Cyclic nucleotide-binding domain protein n=1 Tax=Tetrahymena thermophila (strain SB210) TaxID=312017 RepID=I7MJQ4_TETTS|nr:cyclic nucleotide-binding domain protein [Tetrahymena thermophila SB210]EAR96530.2 cyclic nucleotide-binding domain protein [Tetrahymena thermophila SB210]|eukprot:XP_001016775.2 cyclic nucleotide-binding domain protein [Tetrahymena thermophila SB210]
MNQIQNNTNYLLNLKDSIRILQTEPQFRDEEFLKIVESVLNKQPFTSYFKGLNKQQINNIAKRIKILVIPPNALFISKGTLLDRFFIVLEGYVSVNYGVMDNHQLKYLFIGDSIGSQSLIYQQSANYQAHAGSAGCVLAFLEKQDFNQDVKLGEMIRIQKYISAMKKIDLLKPFNEEQIQQIFFASNLIEVNKNEYVYSFNQPSKGFYFVIQGSVKVFIKNTPINDLTIGSNSPITQPKDSFTTIKELGEGDYFGYYELIEKYSKRIQNVLCSSNKTKLIYLSNGIFWKYFSLPQSKRQLDYLSNLAKKEKSLQKNTNRQYFSQEKPTKQNEVQGVDCIKSFKLNIQQLNTPSFSESSESSLRLTNRKFLGIQENLSSMSDRFRNNQSPVSIFRKIVKNEKLQERLFDSPDQQLMTFGENTEGLKNLTKEICNQKINQSNVKDVSTITPFSYQDDYFQELLKKENTSQNNLNILEQETETADILPSTPQAMKIRQEVLKKQTEQLCEDETNLISEFQINYLKESQTKFSQNSISENSNQSTINFSSSRLIQQIDQTQLNTQLQKNQQNDQQKRSASLNSFQQNINNLSSQQENRFKELQPRILNYNYKVVSSNSPLKIVALTKNNSSKNDEIENSTVALSPSLRLNVSRMSSIRKDISQTQTFLTEKRSTVIKYTQMCNNPRHKKSMSSFFKQKGDLSQSQQLQKEFKQEQSSLLKSPQKYKIQNISKFTELFSKSTKVQKQNSQIIDHKESYKEAQNQNLLKSQQLSSILNISNILQPNSVAHNRFELNLQTGLKTSTNFLKSPLKNETFYLKKCNEISTYRSIQENQNTKRDSQERVKEQDKRIVGQNIFKQKIISKAQDSTQSNGLDSKIQRSNSHQLKKQINQKIEILSSNMNQIKLKHPQFNNFTDYIQQSALIES